MMKKLLVTAIVGCSLLSSASMYAQTIAAITNTDQILVIPNANVPSVTIGPFPVSGLTVGQSIAGLDFRPNTGELYALGYNSGTGDAQLYVINQTTGVATAVSATAINLALGTGSIGFDFNPTVDRIRVVGANGKNYRLHPTTGAIAATDTDLNYAAGDVNNGTTPSIGACAYTNSYIGSESTILYDYDEELNILASQIPPNNGTLNTLGSSGINVNLADRTIDMDIYFDPNTSTNMAYLCANVGASTNDHLYSINVVNGATTDLGQIGLGIAIKDIALSIDRTVPNNVTGELMYGLTRVNGNLITFDSDTSEIIRTLVSITGITAGQRIVGMDVRPANRMLYALGYDTTTTNYQVYTINTTTGVATAVNASAGTIVLGTGNVGFDFNPTVDRIRVVSATGKNYRLNPNDGTIAATDTDLQFAAGDPNISNTPRVGSIGYTNSFNGATSSVLYAIDDVNMDFLTIAPPNNGTLNTIAINIVPFNMTDLTSDLDFYYDSVAVANQGYFSANTNFSLNDDLYSITETGTPTMLGKIGYGVQVRDIAAQLTYTGSPLNIGLEEITNNHLSVYPNPVSDFLNIVLSNTKGNNELIQVTDITGKVVLQINVPAGENLININMSNLQQGIYIVSVLQNGHFINGTKIIKQ